MANKRIWLGMLILISVFGLITVSCTSTIPVLYTNNPSRGFTVLGDVTYEGGKRAGFQDLLQAAKAKYPDCDYVIDVMVDSKETKILFFVNKTLLMRGTAIQFKK